MTPHVKTVFAWILAFSGLYVGVWAAFLPARFFESFPGFGRVWVEVDGMGPYNEHLVRDVGGLYLALAVISIWVAVARRQDLFVLTGWGWLVFNVQHAVFHLRHLDVYEGVDYWANIVTLIGLSGVAALLTVPVAKRHEGSALEKVAD